MMYDSNKATVSQTFYTINNQLVMYMKYNFTHCNYCLFEPLLNVDSVHKLKMGRITFSFHKHEKTSTQQNNT